jgi:hypothetical protein
VALRLRALGEFLTRADPIAPQHASEYCDRVCWIRYEDLTGPGFENVMARVAGRFGLRPRAADGASSEEAIPFRRVEAPVGWSPGAGRQGEWREWPDEWRARFASVIPMGFLGYSIA